MSRRRPKTAREAHMKRVTVRIPEELDRELRRHVTFGPRGETVAKWVRDAVRQRMSMRTVEEIAATRAHGIVPSPPQRVEVRTKGRMKRVTVRILASHEHEIRRYYMRRGETVAQWVRAAIRERVERSHAARIRVERQFGLRPAAAKAARRTLRDQSPSQCR
ncbi:MAG: hypothetical protein OXN97_14885 [Bryobacterales bacterium]|nr:hypothetical protein [Bryobacterales bacterium]